MYKSFGIFPSETRVGNGLTVDAFSDLLITFFYIAFYHHTLDKIPDVGIDGAVMHYFLCNPNLLLELLVDLEELPELLLVPPLAAKDIPAHNNKAITTTDNFFI